MSPNDTEVKLSKVEGYKELSNGLEGTIREVYDGPATHFEEADMQLLKFHGSYQQDDRDARTERRRQGLDKAWMFMLRAKIPGGRMTADQYLAFDEYTNRHANGTLRITSRQGIQFHGIGKEHFKALIQAINSSRLTTMGGCGDINRNTMCCPVVDLDWRSKLGMIEFCEQMADHFTPHSTAYWEIWCDGERWGEKVAPNREEPIYGKTYLPRKFKIAVTVPEDNCVDAYTQDLAFEAVHENGKLIAWDVIVGGGMGFTHGQDQTFPRLGSRLVRCAPEEALQVAEEIVKLQRDFGGRADRKHARLKYTLEDNGVDWFREQLIARIGKPLQPVGPMPEYKVDDHIGWHEANDGKLFVGVHVPNGRVVDVGQHRRKSGLKEIVARFRPGIRLTAKQDIVLTDIDPKDRPAMEAALAEFGLQTELPALRRLAMACVALPTCGLALAESERYMPTLLDELEALGVANAPVEIRMTGCPNSCVRSPMAEIGVVGRGPGKYAIYLGGNQEGTRLAWLFNDKVEDKQLPLVLRDLIDAWRSQTGTGVAFGDWACSQGKEALDQLVKVA